MYPAPTCEAATCKSVGVCDVLVWVFADVTEWRDRIRLCISHEHEVATGRPIRLKKTPLRVASMSRSRS